MAFIRAFSLLRYVFIPLPVFKDLSRQSPSDSAQPCIGKPYIHLATTVLNETLMGI